MSGSRVNTESLNPRHERFLLELLGGQTISNAAKSQGIAEATARRWLALPEVAAAYRSMRHELVDSAVTGMQAAARAAVATLVKNLKANSPAPQIQAARILLEMTIAATQVEALTERMERLEERLAGQRGNVRPIGGARGS
jgi:phage terminase small subunit